jgi:UTP-glucose-1-phosphate uridylyltransferase
MVETVLLNAKRFDCGSVKGYVEAIKDAASNYKFD